MFWTQTLGDLFDFGQLFKAFGKKYLPKSPTFLGKVSKSLILLVKSFLGNFYTHLGIFSGHTDPHSHLSGCFGSPKLVDPSPSQQEVSTIQSDNYKWNIWVCLMP